MAYDQIAANRVRRVLGRRTGVSERKMFGGLAFMLNGHMCCGLTDDRLVLRLGNDGAVEALKHQQVRKMDFTGRPIKSMVYVGPRGYATGRDLEAWVERAVRFVRSLPPK